MCTPRRKTNDMTKITEVIIRALVPSESINDFVDNTEPCGQTIWLSKTTRCNRFNLIGIPAKRLDILFQTDLMDGLVMLEICKKRGKYDGEIRTRICFRTPTINTEVVDNCNVDLVRNDALVLIKLSKGDDTLWSESFESLRRFVVNERIRDLVMWHWTRYFTHLDATVAEELANNLVVPEGTTITSANRLASNRLYEESRSLGWIKLTLRERTKLGFHDDAAMWQREEVVITRRAILAGYASPTGTGEYTRKSAHPIQ
jgi:hypothetical protein